MKHYLKVITTAVVAVVVSTSAFVGTASGTPIACTGRPATQSATGVGLDTANSFGVIAAAAITNGGGSHLNGAIGVFPGTAITGIATIFTDTATATATRSIAVDAQASLITANSSITSQGLRSPIAAELGEQIICPGIYKSDAAFGLTGTLTLDGNNDPNSVFIFVTPAAFTSAAASKIKLINSAKAENVYWQIGAAATLGASSFFKGTILAQAAITTGAGVHVHGRLFSMGAAVTLDSTCIVVPSGPLSGFTCSSE
jgi:type VI secretion system secreted protein VgrG